MSQDQIHPADAFEAECDCLAEILSDLKDDDFDIVTQFKHWTIADVLGHLHMWNHGAMETLKSRENFAEFFKFFLTHAGTIGSMLAAQNVWLKEIAGGVKARSLFTQWQEFYPQLASAYRDADPDQRVAWAGPDMDIKAKMIARQMECWAHGQEIFDVLGQTRKDGERLQFIAHLGVTTYSWTFRNRGQTPPQPKPFVELRSPGGNIWTWNEPQTDNFVKGSATEFCQVVTQTRNIDDTMLDIIGDAASQWMDKAQCFAGPPHDPPAKGTRYKASA